MLFDAEGRIKRYDTPEEVLLEFFDLRLQYYELRRVALLGEATWEHRRASNKIRFILAVIQGQLVVNNRKKADIEGDLEAMGFDKLTKSNPVRPWLEGGGGERYIWFDGDDVLRSAGTLGSPGHPVGTSESVSLAAGHKPCTQPTRCTCDCASSEHLPHCCCFW